MEDRTGTKGQSLSAKACGAAGVDPEVAPLWFDGIALAFAEEPRVAVLPDYPSVVGDRQVAAVELDRLAGLGKIHCYEEGSRPPDLRVCPPHLIVKEDNVRAAHDWSNALYPLNSVLATPPVRYGTVNEFPQLLPPGGAVAPPLPRGQAPDVWRAGGLPVPSLGFGAAPGVERQVRQGRLERGPGAVSKAARCGFCGRRPSGGWWW